jgi:hypothetical protein
MKIKLFTLVGLVGLLLLAACGPISQTYGDQRDEVLAYAEPKVDNLMAALNAGDYAAFVRDYNEVMLKATDEKAFDGLRTLLQSKIGNYVSRQVTNVEQVTENKQQFIRVVYSAKFENEDNVTVRVVFDDTADHPISGLWFDSPKLRQ